MFVVIEEKTEALQREIFLSEVSKRETIAAIEANNDTYLSFFIIQNELANLPNFAAKSD